MSVVYLSGPISLGGSLDASAIAARVSVFTRECARLRALGHEVLNPCEHGTEMETKTWADYMRLDLPMVCRADLVAVLPQWEQSRGALLEAFVANQLGIPVVPACEVAA